MTVGQKRECTIRDQAYKRQITVIVCCEYFGMTEMETCKSVTISNFWSLFCSHEDGPNLIVHHKDGPDLD